MAVTIRIRRDSTSNWGSADPTLASAEIAYDTTRGTFKIGDGATAWSGLVEHAKIPPSVAASDFLVSPDTGGTWVKKTLAEVKSILGISGSVGGDVEASSAADDFLVGDSTTGNWKKATLAEAKTALGLSGTVGGNVPASTAASDFIIGEDATGNWLKKTLAEIRSLLSLDNIDGGAAS